MSGAGDMSDKDPGIMLFGMKIPLQEFQIPPATSQMGCQIQANFAAMNPCSSLKKTEVETESAQNSEQSKNTEDTKQESKNNEQGNELKPNSKPLEDNEESSSNTDQEKSLKKPDKILHCPRCNSLETKFCYFNNYNVNQPRHFCKNCQRYWTAGGTMRNVPVGAGRRKNKHLASQFRHIIVASEGTPAARLEARDHSSTDNNGAVLKFGPDVPLCESMESMLNLRDQKASGEPARSLSSSAENHDHQELSFCASSSSSVANSCSAGNESLEQKCNYPVPPPWIFSWNPSGWNNGGSMMAVHQSPAAMQWCPATIMGVPTVSPPKIPWQFVHGSYWNNGTPVWHAQNAAVSTTTSNSCCSGNGGSPALGKHTRDDSVFMEEEEEKSEICVLVPKTLRIDGPNEKASTRSMMKHDKHLCESENGVLKKEQGNERVLGVSQILEANPAAVSRAHAFQEST